MPVAQYGGAEAGQELPRSLPCIYMCRRYLNLPLHAALHPSFAFLFCRGISKRQVYLVLYGSVLGVPDRIGGRLCCPMT